MPGRDSLALSPIQPNFWNLLSAAELSHFPATVMTDEVST